MKDPSFNPIEFHRYSYVSRGIYIKQIKNWLKYFPMEQMIIITLKDLTDKRTETLNKIFTFLGLTEYEVTDVPNNKKGEYEPMKPKTRARLVKFYRPYNQALEKLLGRKLDWDK